VSAGTGAEDVMSFPAAAAAAASPLLVVALIVIADVV